MAKEDNNNIAKSEALNTMKGSVILWIGFIGRLILNFLFSFTIIRYIGAENYGIINLILTLNQVFRIVIVASLELGLIKYGMEYKNKNQVLRLKKLINKTLKVVFILDIIVCILYIVLAYPIGLFIFQNNEIINYIYYGASILFFFSLDFIYARIILLFQKVTFISIVNFSNMLVYFVFSILFVFVMNLSVAGVFLAELIAYILSSIIFYLIYNLNIKNKLKRANIQAEKKIIVVPIKKLFLFGALMLINSLVTFFNNFFLLNLINITISLVSVGYFSVANNLKNIPVQLSTNIGEASLPSASKLEENYEKIREYFRESVTYTSFILIPICLSLMTLAEPLILIIYGLEFSPSIYITMLLILSILPTNIYSILNTTLIMVNKGSKFLKNNIICAVISILGSILTIQYLGIYSIILFTNISSYLGTILAYYDLNKFVKELKFKHVLKILISAVLSWGIIFLIYKFFPIENLLSIFVNLIYVGLLALGGFGLYLLFIIIFKVFSFKELKNLASNFIKGIF